MDSRSVVHSNWLLSHLLGLFGLATPARVAALSTPFRKFAHLSVYAVLAVLTYRAFALDSGRAFRWSGAWRALVFCGIYACTDEFHQSFVPARTPAVHDVIIDLIGAACALVLVRMVLGRIDANSTPQPPLNTRGIATVSE